MKRVRKHHRIGLILGLIALLFLTGWVTAQFVYPDQERNTPEDVFTFTDYKQGTLHSRTPFHYEAQSAQYYRDEDTGVSVVLFSRDIEFSYTREPTRTVQELANKQGFIVAVNGSFFHGSSVRAEHAGLFQYKGAVQTQLAPRDTQLSHVIVYNHESMALQFQPAATLDVNMHNSPAYTLIQTGPLVLQKNNIHEASITGSLNGTGRYIRTLLGYTDEKEFFFVISTRNYTLTALGQQLLEHPVLQGRTLDVINLDGGSSTSMFTREHETMNYMVDRPLPILIGFR